MEDSSLRTLLLAILAGGVPLGGAVYALFEKVPFLAALNTEPKRYAVAVVSGILGLVCAFLARHMGWLDFPLATSQDIINVAWERGVVIGLAAFAGSQFVHARLQEGRARLTRPR